MPDFTFTNYGSLWLFYPNTDAAAQHLQDIFADRDEVQWWAGGIVVEPRFVHSLAVQLRDDGFIVS